MNLGFVRCELSEDAAQPDRVLAQCRSDPVLTLGRRIAFVEDQVDDLEYRGEAQRAVRTGRDLESDVRLGESPLRADDALGDRRRGDEERACDLLCRQTAEDAKGEGDTGVL